MIRYFVLVVNVLLMKFLLMVMHFSFEASPRRFRHMLSNETHDATVRDAMIVGVFPPTSIADQALTSALIIVMWCRRERLASGNDSIQFAFGRNQDGVIAEVGNFRVHIDISPGGGASGGGGGTPVPVQKDGVEIVAAPTALNLTGAGVAVTDVAGVATVAVAGGGAPATPNPVFSAQYADIVSWAATSFTNALSSIVEVVNIGAFTIDTVAGLDAIVIPETWYLFPYCIVSI